MGLDKYKRPGAVSFVVEGEKFVFELPTKWHKGYTREWQKVLADYTTVDDGGKVRIKVADPLILTDSQITAFVNNCIVDSPLTIDELLGDYVPLTEAIFEAAKKLADEEEKRAEDLVGKLSLGSGGKSAGGAKSLSTTNLNRRAESQPAI